MRSRSLLICALAVAAVAGCKGRSRRFDPETYTCLMLSIGDTLDPAISMDTTSNNLIYNLYDRLFAYDGASTDKLVPRLADKVPTRENGLISKDGLTYTIPIRKGVTFHDGTPLTPEDVRYTLMRFVLTDPPAGPATFLLEPLTGKVSTRGDDGKPDPTLFASVDRAIRVEGDNVVIRLPAPFPPLLHVLTCYGSILSKSWMAAHGGWDGQESTWIALNAPKRGVSPLERAENGSGPFKLAKYDTAGGEALLARYDAYWRGPAKLKRVDIKAVEEFGTRKLMLQSGDADNIVLEPPQIKQLEGMPGVEVTGDIPVVNLGPVIYFSFQTDPAGGYVGSGKLDGEGVPPDFFADADVRKAFGYAMDYDGFIRDVFPGKRALGVLHSSFPGYDPSAQTYSLDLEKAKAHFKKAFGGKLWARGFKLDVTYNTGAVPRQVICNILKRNIESLNPKFKIEVRSLSWSAFLQANRVGKLPLYVLGCNADYPDPHTFAGYLMHSRGPRAHAQHYKNPEADRLVEAAAHEMDPAKRTKLYLQLQRIEIEDAPHLLIVEPTKVRAQRAWVKGWIANGLVPSSPDGNDYYEVWKED